MFISVLFLTNQKPSNFTIEKTELGKPIPSDFQFCSSAWGITALTRSKVKVRGLSSKISYNKPLWTCFSLSQIITCISPCGYITSKK